MRTRVEVISDKLEALEQAAGNWWQWAEEIDAAITKSEQPTIEGPPQIGDVVEDTSGDECIIESVGARGDRGLYYPCFWRHGIGGHGRVWGENIARIIERPPLEVGDQIEFFQDHAPRWQRGVVGTYTAGLVVRTTNCSINTMGWIRRWRRLAPSPSQMKEMEGKA